jgi:hypothetical protein
MTPMEYSLGMCPPPPEEGGKGKRNGRSPQSKTRQNKNKKNELEKHEMNSKNK